MRRFWLVWAVLTSGTAGAAEEPLLLPGSRVRITAPVVLGDRLEAVLLESSDEALVVEVGGASRLRVPRRAIQKLELSLGRKPQVWKGLLWGALAGAVIGALPGDEPRELCSGAAACSAQGAAGGALAGALVGTFVRGQRWGVVSAPDRRPLGVAFVVRF